MTRGAMEITIPGKYVREINRRARGRWAKECRVQTLGDGYPGREEEKQVPSPPRAVSSKIVSSCRVEFSSRSILERVDSGGRTVGPAPEESEEFFRAVGVKHGRKMLAKNRLKIHRTQEIRCLDVMIFEPDVSDAAPLWIAPSNRSSNCWFREDRGELIFSYPMITNAPCLPCPYLYDPYLYGRRPELCEAVRTIGRGMLPLGFVFDLARKKPAGYRFCAAELDTSSVWWLLSGLLMDMRALFEYAANGRKGKKALLIPVDVAKARTLDGSKWPARFREDYLPTRRERTRQMSVWFAKNLARAKEMLPESYASRLAPLVRKMTARAVYLTLATAPGAEI